MKLTKTELQITVLTIVFIQILIESIDNLSFTLFFRHKVKKVANQLQEMLIDKIDNKLFAKDDGSEASQQLIDTSRMLFRHSLILLKVPDKAHVEFDNQFKLFVNKFHVSEQDIEELERTIEDMKFKNVV